MRKVLLSFSFSFYFLSAARAQNDSIAAIWEDAIESQVRNNSDYDFDYDAEWEELSDLRERPLDLNEANRDALSVLAPLLTSAQIDAFLQYRAQYGQLISIYELQIIFPLPVVRLILPFVKVSTDVDGYHAAKGEVWKKGKNEVFALVQNRLEPSVGFLRRPADTRLRYTGDQFTTRFRYRYHYGTRVSYGFTATKSAGEPFLTGVNANGFDFYSFHCFVKAPFRGVKNLALGDFNVSLGQGLIAQNGFSIGKNSMASHIEHDGPTLRKYSSSNEVNFMRGAGAQIELTKHSDATLFASYRDRDATLQKASDSTALHTNEIVATTLQTSGLHRTRTEIKDKNDLHIFSAGGALRYFFTGGRIALNGIYQSFDHRIQPVNKPYHAFSFAGTSQWNASADFTYSVRNLHFFGETALGEQNAIATTDGVAVAVGKPLTLNLLFRSLPKNYHALSAQPFSQNGSSNETGLYIGGVFQPDKRWTANAYADFWRQPASKYLVDGPSHGLEYFTKVDYNTKKLDAYLQIRHIVEQTNGKTIVEPGVHALVDKSRTQIRFNLNRKVSKFLEWRNRAEMAFYEKEGVQSAGWLIHQDVIYKNPVRPLHISARIAFFNTKDYNSAIYDYENDLTYQFTIVPSYYEGSRVYINAGYRFGKHWTVEARVANTYLYNRTTIGTGLDQISAPHRTDVKMQVHIDF